MGNRPGGELAKRPLQFIWVVDCSGSMAGTKIEALNFAISDCLKPMQDEADNNPNAQVLMRVLKFSDRAQWHVATPTDVHDFRWQDLDADGVTDMGHAFRELAKVLDMDKMPDRGLPPVLVLLTDGHPTDDVNGGLKELMDQPWGKRAVRIAIAIGDDVDLDVLQKFIGNNEIKPLKAENARDLAAKIKWASTVPLKAASNPATRSKDQANTGIVPIPMPPQDTVPPGSVDDVF